MGLRYLFSSRSGFSRLVNIISLFGLAIGIALVIVVSSVHHGLSSEIQRRLLEVVPHAFVPQEHMSEKAIEDLRSSPEVVSINPEFKSLVLLQGKTEQITTDIVAKPIDSLLNSNIRLLDGSIKQLEQGGIAISQLLANNLDLNIGDLVRVMFVAPSEAGLTTQSASFILTTTFTTGTDTYAELAFVDIESINNMGLHFVGEMGWHIRVEDPMAIERVVAEYPQAITWIDQHGETFRALQFERIAMYLVMTLVLMLASFNIISGQAMLINVKRGDIAILVTLGMDQKNLAGAFLIQGGVIAVLGITSGLVLGILLALNIGHLFDSIDRLFGIAILDGSLFHELPAEISVLDTAIGTSVAIVLSLLALIQPLRRVLADDPALALNRTTDSIS